MSLLHELSLEGQALALILTPQDKPLDLAISTYRLYFDLVSHLPDNGHHKGLSIAYHENGKIRAIADFVDGRPIGLEYQFNKMGQLSSTKNHGESNSNTTNRDKFKH